MKWFNKICRGVLITIFALLWMILFIKFACGDWVSLVLLGLDSVLLICLIVEKGDKDERDLST